jgi:hypothetical protein
VIPKDCKRLAEVNFPIAEVSRHAAREKSIRHGHPSTLHLEVKGLGAATGTILLTPNERRVAEDRPDCFWLYVVTDCDNTPRLQEPIRDPARLDWNEVTKVAHYYLAVNAMTKPMQVREDSPPYGGSS